MFDYIKINEEVLLFMKIILILMEIVYINAIK